MAKRVLERENLDDACSSCKEKSKPSTVAAMEYATKRAQTKRRSSGACDVLREETEEESDDVEGSEESEDEEVHGQSECSEEEEEEPKEEDIEVEQEDEGKGEEADDEGADEDDRRLKKSTSEPMQRLQRTRKAERKSWILAEARALLDEDSMPAMKERESKEKSSRST